MCTDVDEVTDSESEQKSKELAAGVRQSWADFHAAYAPLHAEKLEAKQRKQAATKHITEICRQQKQAAEDEYKAATEKHKATLAEADSKQADELIQIQQVYKNTVLPLKTKIVELVEASDAQQLKIVEQMRALDKPEKEGVDDSSDTAGGNSAPAPAPASSPVAEQANDATLGQAGDQAGCDAIGHQSTGHVEAQGCVAAMSPPPASSPVLAARLPRGGGSPAAPMQGGCLQGAEGRKRPEKHSKKTVGKSDMNTHKKRKKSSMREASISEAGADGNCNDSEPQADLSDEAALQAELHHKHAVIERTLDVEQTVAAGSACEGASSPAAQSVIGGNGDEVTAATGEEECGTAAHVDTGTHVAPTADVQEEAPAAVLAAVTPVQTPPIVDCAPADKDKTMANKKRCPEDLGAESVKSKKAKRSRAEDDATEGVPCTRKGHSKGQSMDSVPVMAGEGKNPQVLADTCPDSYPPAAAVTAVSKDTAAETAPGATAEAPGATAESPGATAEAPGATAEAAPGAADKAVQAVSGRTHRQQATTAAQQPVKRAPQLFQPQTLFDLAEMQAYDPRYHNVAAGTNAAVGLRPVATFSFVVPPRCSMSPRQGPSRPIMPSVEADAHAAARRHVARGGQLTMYKSGLEAVIFGSSAV